jgi:dTDP-4-dehydrorhamnose reductase
LKALITGAGGQLGAALVRALPGATALGRAELDVRDPDAVSRALREAAPDVVFNASAYNAVDGAESEPEAAFAANAMGVLHLGRACRAAGALLVHFSTDYVFDGSDDRPIPEGRAPHPISVYGASKLAGEALAAASGAAHVVVRTSALFATGGSRVKGGSFVERILERARSGLPLRVVSDQTFAPTYAPDLAHAAVALARSDARGLFHVANEGACSWHELAVAALEAAGVPVAVTPISAAELGAPAARPRYSVLDTARYRSMGLPSMRPWREALGEMLHR